MAPELRPPRLNMAPELRPPRLKMAVRGAGLPRAGRQQHGGRQGLAAQAEGPGRAEGAAGEPAAARGGGGARRCGAGRLAAGLPLPEGFRGRVPGGQAALLGGAGLRRGDVHRHLRRAELRRARRGEDGAGLPQLAAERRGVAGRPGPARCAFRGHSVVCHRPSPAARPCPEHVVLPGGSSCRSP